MLSKNCAAEKFSLLDFFRILKYRISFAIENPDYFDPDGLLCFVGPQGSGKTLSAVNYVYKLMETYPQSILVTNINLTDYPIVLFEEYVSRNRKLYDSIVEALTIPGADMTDKINDVMYQFYLHDNRVFLFRDNDDLARYSNDTRGVIFLIDEIQLYMNSLKSNNINMDVMTQLSQQRKQRKHIVATSQVFGRMAKPVREQFSSVVACKSFLGCLQFNQLIDRDDIDESTDDSHVRGTVKHRFIWTHKPLMYKKYDTYYVIEKGKFVANEDKKGEIYDDAVRLSSSN